jgi:hypothetical protein
MLTRHREITREPRDGRPATHQTTLAIDAPKTLGPLTVEESELLRQLDLSRMPRHVIHLALQRFNLTKKRCQ